MLDTHTSWECVEAQRGNDTWQNEDFVDWPHRRSECSSPSSIREPSDKGSYAPSTQFCRHSTWVSWKTSSGRLLRGNVQDVKQITPYHDDDSADIAVCRQQTRVTSHHASRWRLPGQWYIRWITADLGQNLDGQSTRCTQWMTWNHSTELYISLCVVWRCWMWPVQPMCVCRGRYRHYLTWCALCQWLVSDGLRTWTTTDASLISMPSKMLSSEAYVPLFTCTRCSYKKNPEIS